MELIHQTPATFLQQKRQQELGLQDKKRKIKKKKPRAHRFLTSARPTIIFPIAVEDIFGEQLCETR